jgi:glycosyltransferase involved in cell wall biosynthesis
MVLQDVPDGKMAIGVPAVIVDSSSHQVPAGSLIQYGDSLLVDSPLEAVKARRVRKEEDLRVLIVSEHASAQFGGEAALPLHYFRVLRQRNIPTWLVSHERTRSELQTLFPRDRERLVFVSDTAWQRLMWRITRFLPARLSSFTTEFLIRITTQLAQRRLIRQLVRDKGISVIHQPMPVSPKEPSLIYGVGVPVVIGPMNGGMDYPAPFRQMQSTLEYLALTLGRQLANLMNRLMPGKRQAAMLVVANERTRAALPNGVGARIKRMAENGVDLNLWKSDKSVVQQSSLAVMRYVFMGRLVDLKAVDLLLLAFKRAVVHAPMSLSIVGDGVERASLERLAQELEILSVEGPQYPGTVYFLGWRSQADCAELLRQSHALVLPSLMECGGAVVLEAMAMEIPVVATAWGGPADYLDSSCGILVEPTSRQAFIENLAVALVRLAKSPQERIAMGRAGRAKVIQHFDWEVKVDHMLAIYRQVVADSPSQVSSRG